MFKNKLITALVITIAMLCGIVFFGHTSPSFSTGQIFTLILGALAWLALLFFPSALQQQQQPPLVEASSLSNNFTNLLSDIQTELTGHINATEAELTQIKSIMDNAIDDLVDSFISLEACARIEQKLVMLLATSENVKDNDELNPFREKQLKSKQFLLETSKKN